MQKIDLHQAINAISDVVINRPPAIRAFDQIFMKFGDMLIQADLISRRFNKKNVVFIGDGDSISLCIVHLKDKKIFPNGPKFVLVLDFDERVVNAINNFAIKNHLNSKIKAELYNVADPLPRKFWSKFDAFYTNPPFGSSNEGLSLQVFVKRGIEATNNKAIGCIIAADSRDLMWTKNVLFKAQQMLLEEGFLLNEINHNIHQYHLEDNPELTSCNIFVSRYFSKVKKYTSKALDSKSLKNFYGKNNPLRYYKIEDLTYGGKFISKDFKFIQLKKGKK